MASGSQVSEWQHGREAGYPMGRRITFAALSVALLAALVALVACSGSTTQAGGGTTPSGFAPTTSASGPSGTSATTGGTPSPSRNGPNGAATPGTTAATTFQVSGVTAWVNDGGETSLYSPCAPTRAFTFLGIITFPAGTPGGTLQYFWSRISEPNADQPVQTVTIQAGQTELQVTDTWNVSAARGDGHYLIDKMFIQSPNIVISNNVHIILMCAFYVTGVAGSLPTKYSQWCPSANDRITNANLTLPFSFTIDVDPSPGGTVQYTIAYTAPTGAPTPAPTAGSQVVGGGVPSVAVSSPWKITAGSPTGQYTETLTITSPTYQYSPASVTFTKTC